MCAICHLYSDLICPACEIFTTKRKKKVGVIDALVTPTCTNAVGYKNTKKKRCGCSRRHWSCPRGVSPTALPSWFVDNLPRGTLYLRIHAAWNTFRPFLFRASRRIVAAPRIIVARSTTLAGDGWLRTTEQPTGQKIRRKGHDARPATQAAGALEGRSGTGDFQRLYRTGIFLHTIHCRGQNQIITVTNN